METEREKMVKRKARKLFGIVDEMRSKLSIMKNSINLYGMDGSALNKHCLKDNIESLRAELNKGIENLKTELE